MAEEQNNNSGGTDQNTQLSGQNTPVNNLSSASGNSNSAAVGTGTTGANLTDNKPVVALPGGSSVVTPRGQDVKTGKIASGPDVKAESAGGKMPVKKKTPHQIERERERRRRRRQAKMKATGVLKVGKDVPLILSSKVGDMGSISPPLPVSMKEINATGTAGSGEQVGAHVPFMPVADSVVEPVPEEASMGVSQLADMAIPVSVDNGNFQNNEETVPENIRLDSIQETKGEAPDNVNPDSFQEIKESIPENVNFDANSSSVDGVEDISNQRTEEQVLDNVVLPEANESWGNEDSAPENETEANMNNGTQPEIPVPPPQIETYPDDFANQQQDTEVTDDSVPAGAFFQSPEENEMERTEDTSSWQDSEASPMQKTELVEDYVAEDVPEVIATAGKDLSKPEENAQKQVNQQQVEEIQADLMDETVDGLDELPAEQGLLGKFFDWLAEFVDNRKHGQKPKKEEVAEEAVLVKEPENMTTAKSVGFSLDVAKIWPTLKTVLTILLFGAVLVGAFWFGSSLKLYDRLVGLFAPKPGEELLVQGDNAKVTVDEEMLNKYGFKAIIIFAKNGGNKADQIFDVFYNAVYFGKLKEPVFFGETGITAAIYYGFGRDAEFLKNRFIYYVKFLQKLSYADTVNVYDVMDGKVDRDSALNKYINDSNTIFDQGNILRKEINAQLDDLQISMNSLTPDKNQYETDFFASLNDFEAEKADMLMKKYIDISQKQVELKAKSAALTKLSANYEKVLLSMKVKLEAIQKNREALISGIKVTEVPGANLDLVKTE